MGGEAQKGIEYREGVKMVHNANDSFKKLQELEEIFFYVSIGDEKMQGIKYSRDELTEIHKNIRQATEKLYKLMERGE